MHALPRLAILTLALASGAFCTAAQTPNALSQAPEPPPDPTSVALFNPHAFFADDRVEVLIPSQPLKVAEENEISLKIHFPGLSTMESKQSAEGYPLGVDGGDQQLPILRHGDGSAYFKFVPLALGKLELFVIGSFPDAGIFRTRVTFDVGPPDRPPAIFHIGGLTPADNRASMDESRCMGRLGYRQDLGCIQLFIEPRVDASIDAGTPPQTRHINPQALYDGTPQVIAIPSQLVHFKVRSDGHVIDLDENTGMITPVNPGSALIEATYFGVTDHACVMVTRGMSDSVSSRCEGLHPLEPDSFYAFRVIVKDTGGNPLSNVKVSVADEPNPAQIAHTDETGLVSFQLSTVTRFILLKVTADGYREEKMHMTMLPVALIKHPFAITLWRPSEQRPY